MLVSNLSLNVCSSQTCSYLVTHVDIALFHLFGIKKEMSFGKKNRYQQRLKQKAAATQINNNEECTHYRLIIHWCKVNEFNKSLGHICS